MSATTQQEFAYYFKAKNASVRKSLGITGGFFWCSGTKEKIVLSRAALAIDDAGFDEDDFARPVRVNFPVVDDLPAEGVFDTAFCDRYELGGDDNKTMVLIPGTAPATPAAVETSEATTPTVEASAIVTKETATFEQRVLGAYLLGPFERLNHDHLASIDLVKDKEYPHTILSALNTFEFRQLRHAFPETVFNLISDIKSIWIGDETPDFDDVQEFTREWVEAHNNVSLGAAVGEKPLRKEVTEKWIAKFARQIMRTDSGTNAGGGIKTDRNPDYEHTLDTLDQEIALATLPMDFDIYDFPVSVHRRAKDIITKKESPFKEWSAALRSKAGILDYSRAAIFALIRNAEPEIYHFPVKLNEYINANLVEYVHDKPTAETLAAAGHIAEQSTQNTDTSEITPDDSGRELEPQASKEETTDYPVATMRLALRVLAQFINDKPVHNIGQDERLQIGSMNLDTDDSYVQNLLLAVRNIPDIEDMGIPSLWKLIDAVKWVFPTDKRTELALLINFMKIWLATPAGDRTALVNAWAGGHRINEVKPETTNEQPRVENLGNGVFPIDGLVATDDQQKKEEEISDVQIQETVGNEKPAGDEVLPGESNLAAGEEADPVTVAENQNSEEVNQNSQETASAEPETQGSEPEIAWPEYFEPGRYVDVPNEVYHSANGISSTMVKAARVSLMYFEARHVSKTITKERSAVLDMGNLVHALALQPDTLEKEFSVEPEIPAGAFTTTATIRTFIDEYNASLPPLLSADDIKVLLEEYNATLPAQVPLGASAEETGQSYMALPAEFQRIEEGQKQTAAAMKACIKEYNATLPAQMKTSGSRDALLEQLAIINPDLVAQEAQKAQPLKVSGTKTDLMQVVKSVNPDAVFADELLDAWRENPEGKVLVTRQQLSTALAIQKSLLNHPTAGKLLQHPSRSVEVSYFGIDDETGLDIRVRPDLEIEMDTLRIGADLKTISMWNIKQDGLRAKLHREIIERDYHLSAAMYCETAALDQFYWIFVNKDENYHWIAIIEASTELLELGMLEYRKAMRAIAHGFDTGEWPAPITEDDTEELNDFDLRRLEALRGQA